MTSTTTSGVLPPGLAAISPRTRRRRVLQPATRTTPRLTEASLPLLAGRAAVPAYDRRALRTGVVHLGVGNFHRAHQAVYFDELARLGLTRWGITGVGSRSRRAQELLAPQDLLFTVAELSPAGPAFRVVGALHRYVYAPDRPAQAVAALAAPGTALVTLTLTGDGYPGSPLAPGARPTVEQEGPGRTCSPFGHLVDALDVRRRTGRPGLTVLSCDNRPDSAAAARASVLALADARDPALARWVETHVSFPDSMVDRITPATDDGHRQLVLEGAGVLDRWPVATETFTQWVVEDSFAAERPPLDEAGVQYVTDVRPWKEVKTRLLNGTHCALGHLGLLAGHADTAAASTDPLVRDYLTVLMRREVSPLLPRLAGLDLVAYQRSVLDRVANPALVDPLTRLAGRASTKLPSYLLPSLVDALDRRRPYELLTLAVAAWIRCLQGAAVVDGQSVELVDARLAELRPLALAGGTDPRPLLASGLFGRLADHRGFTDTLSRLLADLSRRGVRPTLADALARSSRDDGPIRQTDEGTPSA